MYKLPQILFLCLALSLTACKKDESQSQSIQIKTPEWYSGSTDPDSSLGTDKDHYMNNVSGDMFKKESGTWNLVSNMKGADGSQGVAGQDGAAGQNGLNGSSSKWISGNINPDPSQGVDSDMYLNTVSNDIFKKENGTWTLQVNIKGATGAIGATGAAGANGSNGLSTIAGKEVQTASTAVNNDVLVYDEVNEIWIAKKIDISDTTGDLAGTRVSGDISGNASSITGSIGQTQVIGLSGVLSAVATQITDLFTNKADKAAVLASDNALQANIDTKASSSDLSSGLASKVDQSAYNTNKTTTDDAIALKANTSTVNTALATKVDKTTYDTDKENQNSVISSKASTTSLNTAVSSLQNNINGKVDQTAYNTNKSATDAAIADKADSATINTALSNKLDTATYDSNKTATDTAIASKASSTDLTNGLNTKLSLSGGQMTGDLQLADKADGVLTGAINKAKMWYNNAIKYFDGTTVQQVAVKSELGTLAAKSQVENVDIAAVDQSKISGATTIGGFAHADKVVKADGAGYLSASFFADGSIPVGKLDSAGLVKTSGTNTLTNDFMLDMSSTGRMLIKTTAVGGGVQIISADYDPLVTATSMVRAAALDVSGQIVSRTKSLVGTSSYPSTINFIQSNTMSISVSGTPATGSTIRLNLLGMVDGGAYTLVVKGVASSQYTFAFDVGSIASGNSVIPAPAAGSGTSSSASVKFNPANGLTDLGKDSIYNFLVINGTVYVTWMSGF